MAVLLAAIESSLASAFMQSKGAFLKWAAVLSLVVGVREKGVKAINRFFPLSLRL